MKKIKKENENKYVFVNGNTKFLKDCTAEEMALLVANGSSDFEDTATPPVAQQASTQATEKDVADEIATQKGKK